MDVEANPNSWMRGCTASVLSMVFAVILLEMSGERFRLEEDFKALNAKVQGLQSQLDAATKERAAMAKSFETSSKAIGMVQKHRGLPANEGAFADHEVVGTERKEKRKLARTKESKGRGKEWVREKNLGWLTGRGARGSQKQQNTSQADDLICYMIEGPEEEFPPFIEDLASLDNTWVVWGSIRHGMKSVWKDGKVSVLELGDPSWAKGRNRLYNYVRKHADCAYYAYLDSDVRFALQKHIKPGAVHTPPRAGEEPLEYFHRLLRTERPPAAFPFEKGYFQWGEQPFCGEQFGLSQVGWTFDAIAMAFHRETAPLFLPYSTKLENVSWWTGTSVMIELNRLLFPVRQVGYKAIHVFNQEHSPYTRQLADRRQVMAEAERLLRKRVSRGCADKLIRAVKSFGPERAPEYRRGKEPVCKHGDGVCCGGTDYGIYAEDAVYSPTDVEEYCSRYL